VVQIGQEINITIDGKKKVITICLLLVECPDFGQSSSWNI